MDIHYSATLGYPSVPNGINPSLSGGRRQVLSHRSEVMERGSWINVKSDGVKGPSLDDQSTLIQRAIGLTSDIHSMQSKGASRSFVPPVDSDDDGSSDSGDLGDSHPHGQYEYRTVRAQPVGRLAVSRAVLEGFGEVVRAATLEPLMGLTQSLVSLLGGECMSDDDGGLDDEEGLSGTEPLRCLPVFDEQLQVFIGQNKSDCSSRSDINSDKRQQRGSTTPKCYELLHEGKGEVDRVRDSFLKRRRMLESSSCGMDVASAPVLGGSSPLVSASTPSVTCTSKTITPEALYMAKISGAVTSIQQAIGSIQVMNTLDPSTHWTGSRYYIYVYLICIM